jgi:DNA-binding transcriptional LysR family regulator
MTIRRHPRGVFRAAPTPVAEDLAPRHRPGRGGIGAAVRTDTARPAAEGRSQHGRIVMRRRGLMAAAAAGGLGLLAAPAVRAQDAWPKGKQIRVICPWPPGAANGALLRRRNATLTQAKEPSRCPSA